ncbi:hypothetical protein LZ30DRAFT_106670 [Colletotrichum cereale]|nr:hypothetical protein LZ30DRAFT_106670 [Colletotrichum cereale]
MSPLVEAKALTEGERNLLITLSGGFRRWFQHDEFVSIGVDAVTSMLLNCVENYKTAKVATASRKAYGLVYKEVVSIQDWVRQWRITPHLKPALSKMPPATGLVIRFTNLDNETIEMLDKQEGGRPGIYEVQDLVRNSRHSQPSTVAREIMATSINLGYRPGSRTYQISRDYVFIINSKSGRYIDAIGRHDEREVVFAQEISGKFKLLGKQDLNGGEAAKSARTGFKGPYAVYYFDEIEAPTLSTQVTVNQMREALEAEGIET